MAEHVAAFIDAMCSAGIGPEKNSDIVADDKPRRYRVRGDRPGKKNGAYRLKVEGDFSVGWFKDWSEGITHPWGSNGSNKKFTPEERNAWKEKVAAERKRQDEEDANAASEAAKKAKAIWDGAEAAPEDHPYLIKKAIGPHNARIHEGNLIISIYSGKKFAGIQTITPNGDKKYFYKMAMEGSYTLFGSKDDDKARILVCEGWATAASLRECTGHIVICTLDKNNLTSASRYFRDKYPDSQFIFCADEDQWSFAPNKKPEGVNRHDFAGDAPEWQQWREQGFLLDVGRQAAEQAAAHIGAHVVGPGFAPDNPDKLTDFNDLHVLLGPQAVVDAVSKIKKPASLPEPVGIVRDNEQWRNGLLIKRQSPCGSITFLHENSFNYSLIIRKHTRLQGCFVWDEFHHCVMVVKCLPTVEDEGGLDKFEPHPLDDIDVRECDYFIQNLGMNLNGSVEKTRAGIEDAAFRNVIHPARDYLDSLKWDGVPRLHDWLITYLGCEKDDPAFVRGVGRAWMIAAVMRLYEPGSKFDHMLIFEGAQGVGKSTALRIMSTFGEGDNERAYFLDSLKISNCEDPDELMKLTGRTIVEIQEMTGFNKKDDDALKAFITTTEDIYRAPYGRTPKTWPRQFVLAGTYNPTDGIFKDPTGLRRFWVVATGRIDLQALRRDRTQIWAEAVHRYKAGEGVTLSAELSQKAEVAAGGRRIVDDMEKQVLDAAAGKRYFETSDIMAIIGIPNKGRSQQESRTINKILMVNGFVRSLRKQGNRSIRCWEAPNVPMQKEIPLYPQEEEIEF